MLKGQHECFPTTATLPYTVNESDRSRTKSPTGWSPTDGGSRDRSCQAFWCRCRVPCLCGACLALPFLPSLMFPCGTVFRAYSQLHLGGKWGPKLSFISLLACLHMACYGGSLQVRGVHVPAYIPRPQNATVVAPGLVIKLTYRRGRPAQVTVLSAPTTPLARPHCALLAGTKR